MILTVAVTLYGVGAVVCARLMAGHLAWKWKSQFVERPEALDWLGGACFGLCAGLVWPALVVSRLARRIELPAVGAEREARIRRRELDAAARREAAAAHIAELERNIDADPEDA